MEVMRRRYDALPLRLKRRYWIPAGITAGMGLAFAGILATMVRSFGLVTATALGLLCFLTSLVWAAVHIVRYIEGVDGVRSYRSRLDLAIQAFAEHELAEEWQAHEAFMAEYGG